MRSKKCVALNVRLNGMGAENLTPEDIVSLANQKGFKAVALTSVNTVRDFPEFSKAIEQASPDFKGIYGVRLYCLHCDSKPYPITLLAKNRLGLNNMHRILSSKHRYSRRYKTAHLYKGLEYVLQNREGILIGKECSWKYIYDSIDKDESDLYDELNRIYQNADFVEMAPWSENPYQGARFGFGTHNGYLENTARTIVEHLSSINIIPITTSDGTSLLKPVSDILKDYAYLGDLSEKTVIDNPAEIAKSIEKFNPFDNPPVYISLPNAENEVRELCVAAAKEKCGDSLPKIIAERIQDEFSKISDSEGWSHYLLTYKLVRKCEELGYLYSCTRRAGASFVAYLLGITEVNPLPPHYYCAACKRIEWVDQKEYPSGYDLNKYNATKKFCKFCGGELEGDGHNISCEFFLGCKEAKIPDFNFNVGNILGQPFKHPKAELIEYIGEILGTNNIYRACSARESVHPGGIIFVPENSDIYDFAPTRNLGQRPDILIDYRLLPFEKIDIFTSETLSKVQLMEEYTGIRAKSIQFDDIDIASFFRNDSLNGLLREKAFLKEIIDIVSPHTFLDLLKISSYMHEAEAWAANVKNYFWRDYSWGPDDTIKLRNDIMLSFIKYDRTRKKGLDTPGYGAKEKPSDEDFISEQLKVMKEKGAPELLIESLGKMIQNLFIPKAPAVESVMNFLRMVWYKIHYPLEYFAAVLSFDGDFPKGISPNSNVDVENALQDFKDKWGDWIFTEMNGDIYEENRKFTLEIMLECFENGISFLPADINISDADKFVPENGNIRIPYNMTDIFTPKYFTPDEVEQINEERKKALFKSRDDFIRRIRPDRRTLKKLAKDGFFDSFI